VAEAIDVRSFIRVSPVRSEIENDNGAVSCGCTALKLTKVPRLVPRTPVQDRTVRGVLLDT
jgi:hypothetical protein